METMETLKTRRTIYDFKKDPVDRSIIEEVIHCAVLAPNHKMTEPWHFYVIQGDRKELLATRRRELKWTGFLDQDSERAQKAGEKAYQQMVDIPCVIAVTTHRYSVDPVREREDYAATSCAIQNLMLAAWDRGVGSKWGTGPLTKDKEAREIIGIAEEEAIAGFLFLGYPEKIPHPKKRHLNESITWLT
ncbi:nitroreductase [Alteribacillus sp. HJP-4]|uniref:nitroreductase family protein n=1 Tax=Alteribacillus sp. HJP-4 TaxID=2775394 RepID=UPI0035CCD4C6